MKIVIKIEPRTIEEAKKGFSSNTKEHIVLLIDCFIASLIEEFQIDVDLKIIS